MNRGVRETGQAAHPVLAIRGYVSPRLRVRHEYKITVLMSETLANKTDGTRFSHVVIFWTDPAIPNAADELIAGANKYLRPIPGVLHFHIGKMATSHRPVVDQTYQVALNLVFPDKKTQDDYQVHPQHVEFVEKVFKRVCKRVVVYDFQ
jgi:hypothetical protein